MFPVESIHIRPLQSRDVDSKKVTFASKLRMNFEKPGSFAPRSRNVQDVDGFSLR